MLTAVRFQFSGFLFTIVAVKKLLTLFLLFLFLLNVLGYYGVFVGLQLRITQQLKQNFDDENYLHKEITFKVPLAVPYSTDAKEFNRVDGEFKYKGEVYRLVKQRLQSDTLFIVCVKDSTTKRINQALEDYVKTFTDKPVSSKGNSKSIQNLNKDFLTNSISIEKQNAGWEKTLLFYLVQQQYERVNISLNSPPPRA